jgi:hypothetical protein
VLGYLSTGLRAWLAVAQKVIPMKGLTGKAELIAVACSRQDVGSQGQCYDRDLSITIYKVV